MYSVFCSYPWWQCLFLVASGPFAQLPGRNDYLIVALWTKGTSCLENFFFYDRKDALILKI